MNSEKILLNGCSQTQPILEICEQLKKSLPWILSPSGSRVRTSVMQIHLGKELRGISPVFGMKVGVSFAQSGPGISFWKTVQTSLIEDLNQYSIKFPQSGIMQ